MVVDKPLPQKPLPPKTPLRLIRYWYLKLLRQEGTPEAIARGLACGVFAGSFPIFGLQTLVGLLLATLIEGNKFTAAMGTWISNPITYVPIFYFNFRVGEVVLRQSGSFNEEELASWAAMGEAGLAFIATLFIGCLVVGPTLAICAYFASLFLMSRWRSLRERQGQNSRK